MNSLVNLICVARRELILAMASYGTLSILVFGSALYTCLFIPSIFKIVYIKSLKLRDEDETAVLYSFLEFIEYMNVFIATGESIESSVIKYIREKSGSGTGSKFFNVVRYYALAFNQGLGVKGFFEKLEDEYRNVAQISYLARMISTSVDSGGDIVSLINETIKNTRQTIAFRLEIEASVADKKMEIKVMQLLPFAFLAIMKLSFSDFFVESYTTPMGVLALFGVFAVFELSSVMSHNITRIDMN